MYQLATVVVTAAILMLWLADIRKGRCFNKFESGHCREPSEMLVTKAKCCCSKGAAWQTGKDVCELCPSPEDDGGTLSLLSTFLLVAAACFTFTCTTLFQRIDSLVGIYRVCTIKEIFSRLYVVQLCVINNVYCCMIMYRQLRWHVSRGLWLCERST